MKRESQFGVTALPARLLRSGRRPFTASGLLITALVLGLPSASRSAGPVQVLKRPTPEQCETVRSMAFSPDGRILAVGSIAPSLEKGRSPGDTPLPEGTIEVWDLHTGALTTTLRQSARTEDGHNQAGALAFSPDGKWLIVGDVPGYTLWEVATSKQKLKWRSGMGEPLSPGWSPDGKWIALPTILAPGLPAYESGPWGVGLVDAATGKAKMFSAVESGYPRSARISPSGKLLATAGADCYVRVFDTEALTNVFTDKTDGTLFAVGFSPDGHTLFAGPGPGGALLVYEIRSNGSKVTIGKKGTTCPGAREIHSVEFSADGKRALSNSYGGIVLWDAATWSTFKALADAYGCLAPDGNRIAVARNSARAEIEIWRLSEWEMTIATPQR